MKSSRSHHEVITKWSWSHHEVIMKWLWNPEVILKSARRYEPEVRRISTLSGRTDRQTEWHPGLLSEPKTPSAQCLKNVCSDSRSPTFHSSTSIHSILAVCRLPTVKLLCPNVPTHKIDWQILSHYHCQVTIKQYIISCHLILDLK